MKQCIDVTSEYLNKSTKEIGSIIFDNDYNVSEHSAEVEIAIWLHNSFGGNIKLIKENSRGFGVKTSDYEWNGRLWELKTLKSAKSIDSALRKAIEQIFGNPGGVILDFENGIDNISQIEKMIKSRVETSCRFKIDIIIMSINKLEKVVRYN